MFVRVGCEWGGVLITPSIGGGFSPGSLILTINTFLSGISAEIIPANTGRIRVFNRFGGVAGDHPREYGENFCGPESESAVTGSSPRIRGEFGVIDLDRPPSGIIPANTGRISRPMRAHGVIGDHPREYGENPFEWSDWQFWCGSSPRIRGELRVGRPWQLTWGIIPANTGRIHP